MSDPTTPEGRAELRDKIRAAWPARALTHGRGMHVPPVRDGGNTAACIDLAVELAVEHFAPAPCVMTHTPPFDFAQCETHDETFPLGESCRFDGRDMVEVLFEAVDEQRGRAVRAELERDRAEAALARVREYVDDLANVPNVGYDSSEQWELDTRREVARELRAVLDGDR
ncbi:hypothetical protein ACWDUD_01475 [Rhodococcus sp. NPDC003382]|uniref:hypothetical protein n=1 Tax=Rhodococcus sp. CX TaxID=2789880 RepID=UPI0018CDFEC0|nr:hypothetical protein [Rhodococcus sp. CX]MBH0123647.1 hypothetical protein [Rhodococcus sp. CX]